VDPVRRIADAVLYEGYILWPYRKSALKNQRRFGFGTVYPGGFNQTECLLEAEGDCRVEVTVRFLHVVERQLWRGGRRVDELEIGGELHQSWEEAVERELRFDFDTCSPVHVPVNVEAGVTREELGGGCAVERSWRALKGSVKASVLPLRTGLFRLRVRTENATLDGEFRSAQTVLVARDGTFVSLTDPPSELRAEADACENVGAWPVLVGEEGDRSTLLASPIILPDYPEIAPESPGDLFDATEIDQMLVLNILSLTEEEKREMRSADPRAREILERTESLSEEELMRLHGTIREFGLARRP
jgi:hypothetical protein